MTPRDTQFGVYVLTGIGAGALAGVVAGLLATRRPPAPTPAAVAESVEELKRRAEQILSELSGPDAVPGAQR